MGESAASLDATPNAFGRASFATMDILRTAAAAAPQPVTLCQSDVQGGPGYNLSQALAAGGQITFNCSGASATISMTQSYDVRDGTVIDGGDRITLDAGGRTGMFRFGVHSGNPDDSYLRLMHIVLSGGKAAVAYDGGIVDAAMHVYLDHVRIEQSTTPIRLRGGTLSVVDSQFSDNKSFVVVARNIAIQRALFQNNPGVAIQSDGPGNITLEASLANGHIEVGLENALPCTLTIVDTKFERNRARVGGALLTGCDTAISGGKFINNTAFDGDGGAIYMTGTVPKLQLRRVKFENNTTNHGGGALKIPPNEMHSVVSLRFVTFTGNSAGRGGAIDLGEPGDQSLSATVSASVFKGNKARNEGGAIYAGGVALGLARVVFVDNTAQQGGAVALSPRVGGRTVIANSLFARNAAAHGSAVLGSLVDIVNSTIVGNTDGAALEAGYINAGERDAFSFANTIIADNSVGNCRASDTVTLRDNGPNLQHADGSCGGSIEVNDPVLDSLLVPSLGSPALNRGDDEICREPAVAKVDILGQKRPRGSHCTIGAYEGDIERFANLFWHDRIEHPHWPWER